MPAANPQKQLRRLPQVFSQFLELPLHSHADVFIQDRSDCFQFTANVDANTFSGQVRAHVVKIHPEVTKLVFVKGGGDLVDKLEVDVWRFRLPETTRPELEESSLLQCQREAEAAAMAERTLKMKVTESGLDLYIK